jgi:hypothetical protein
VELTVALSVEVLLAYVVWANRVLIGIGAAYSVLFRDVLQVGMVQCLA